MHVWQQDGVLLIVTPGQQHQPGWSQINPDEHHCSSKGLALTSLVLVCAEKLNDSAAVSGPCLPPHPAGIPSVEQHGCLLHLRWLEECGVTEREQVIGTREH